MLDLLFELSLCLTFCLLFQDFFQCATFRRLDRSAMQGSSTGQLSDFITVVPKRRVSSLCNAHTHSSAPRSSRLSYFIDDAFSS